MVNKHVLKGLSALIVKLQMKIIIIMIMKMIIKIIMRSHNEIALKELKLKTDHY